MTRGDGAGAGPVSGERLQLEIDPLAEAGAKLEPGAVQEALGGLGSHLHLDGDLRVSAILELVQLQGGALPAGQPGNRRADDAG